MSTQDKLAAALREAREFVQDELSDRENRFAGYAALGETQFVKDTLAKIDAALQAHADEAAQAQAQSGVSMRDYFAMNASEHDLKPYLERPITTGYSESGPWQVFRTREQARFAYADAMLAAAPPQTTEPVGEILTREPDEGYARIRWANDFRFPEGTKLYTHPQPPVHAVTDADIERAVRVHDIEDAAQKGEPDPWADDFPEPYRSERMAAMRLAIDAAMAKESER